MRFSQNSKHCLRWTLVGNAALAQAQGLGSDTPLAQRKSAHGRCEEPIAEAIIENGRFSHVGTTERALELKPAGAKIIDAKGSTVIPGLNDSHTHVVRGGMMYALELRWDNVTSIEEGLQMIRDKQPAPRPIGSE